jgi:amidase
VNVNEFVEHDGVGLAGLIRGGQVSAAEAHTAAQEAIEQVNPDINALVGELFDAPLAYNADGPFAGIPFAIKDFALHAQDVPTRLGTRLTGDGIPFPYDTELMRRFRAAGLATLAMTTTPELGFSFSTENIVDGPTRNPWDTTRSAGGSSGGTGALVAARGVPFAHGNDGAGSIRCPAAWCGLVGLKPSRGLVTVAPDHSDPLLGRGLEFALTRTVRDCAALLDAVHGPAVGERFILPAPERPFAAELEREPGRLRVAVATTPWNDAPVDPQHVAAVERVARELEALGHHVVESKPAFDNDAYETASWQAWAGFIARAAEALGAATGTPVGPDTLEATIWATVQAGRELSGLDIFAAREVDNQVMRAVAQWFLDFDVLITPTTATPPPPLGTLDANDASTSARAWWDQMLRVCPFTALFNATGDPALSLPLAETSDGLPIGVQLVAPYTHDATLIRLAAQLEQALPWADRRPGVCAG